MVKELIKGILGKGSKKEDKEEIPDEVPDELPSLAEDIGGDESDPKDAVPDELPDVKDDSKDKVPDELPKTKEDPKDKVPDELPSVDKSKVPDELPVIAPKTEPVVPQANPLPQSAPTPMPQSAPTPIPQTEPTAIPQNQPITQSAPVDATPATQVPPSETPSELPVPADKPPQDTPTIEPITADQRGFFLNIAKHIKEQDARDKLLSGDLFSRMSNYYELRKHEIKTGTPISNEQKIEDELIKELTDLQNLETKWQTQRMALEEDLKFLHQREKEIQLKIAELEKTKNEIKLFKNVEPKNYFRLYNNVIIKNLHELIDSLEIMDEETFNHHVNQTKNDFSHWINHVIKDSSLAEKIGNAKSREELISILETEPIRSKDEELKTHKLDPDDYFWLKNGVVIKSIYELNDALKTIEDATFKEHVNGSKNDLSDWVLKVTNNNYLAEKLSKQKTRQEIIETLEAFL